MKSSVALKEVKQWRGVTGNITNGMLADHGCADEAECGAHKSLKLFGVGAGEAGRPQ